MWHQRKLGDQTCKILPAIETIVAKIHTFHSGEKKDDQKVKVAFTNYHQYSLTNIQSL